MTKTLNWLHRRKFYALLTLIITIAYFFKGYGFVQAKYHTQFRAYEFKVKGVSYLSIGPGWAYSFAYLKNLLIDTFCHFYIPKKGDCVVDIGAGLGEEALVTAQLVSNSGSVYAIEANPITFKGLDFANKSNDFYWAKVINVAVSNMDGEVTIEDDTQSYLGNTINKAGNIESVPVKALTFDSLVRENKIGRIDFLKVNIEGAEQLLIQGMDASIQKVRNICISCHDFRHRLHGHGEFYVTKEKVTAFLINQGFEIVTRRTGNNAIDDFVYGKNSRL
ncbi:MAG: FkbM family methyltransferase [Cyclobacteriaceae bacterium]